MTQMTIEDICEGRHHGAETSVLANSRVSKEADRGLIYRRIKQTDEYGMTLDELCIVLDRMPNAISGRITELRVMGKLRVSDRKRKTRSGSLARVYVAI